MSTTFIIILLATCLAIALGLLFWTVWAVASIIVPLTRTDAEIAADKIRDERIEAIKQQADAIRARRNSKTLA